MQNVAYIISFVEKALGFEWVAEELDKKRFKLTFILLNPELTPWGEYLRSKGATVAHVPYRGKKDIPGAILKTRKILKKERIDVVHAHLFDACLVGLTAAKLAGIRRRIHTRHNATIHHQYHPHMVKYDRYINRLSSDIVSISKNVTEILVDLERVKPEKITVVHHGFRLDQFNDVPQERTENLRRKYLPDHKGPVVGVISRYIEWKGIQYIIPAFSKLLQDQPDAKLLLANASGPDEHQIKTLLSELPLGSYVEVPFESDLFALYRLFDLFVHVPVDQQSEAFGQIYVEALASGIPSVFTMSGIARDFVRDEYNALVVPFRDSDAIYAAITRLTSDDELRNKLIENGKQSVAQDFVLEKMIQSLEDLYSKNN